MKRLFYIIVLLFSVNTYSQVKLPALSDTLFLTYYHQRASFFKSMPLRNNEVIFLGNSITDGAEWAQLFNDNRIINQGISGDISAGVIHRLDAVVKRKPSKIFLLIGTNDLARGISADSVLKNIFLISDYIKQESPATQLFVQSILPVNDAFEKFKGHTKNTALIQQLNTQLKANAASRHFQYVDLFSSFANENGKLKNAFTNDGLHLMGNAYLQWKHIIYPFVYDLQPKPSLIPQPQQLQWKQGSFALYQCKTIVVKDKTLQKEALQLQQWLQSIGWEMQLMDKVTGIQPYIEISLEKLKVPQQESEAYNIDITTSSIKLIANTPHGIFSGIQTIKQLLRDGSMVDACTITDWPAFSWRGYMIDVGRNYIEMNLLKQQIDVMAAYKLNVFHFHATEDIAWRIAIKQYPQLTSPEFMLRNKGMYYSEDEIKELIAYCKERHITFVPEIDMPGHSAAFKRAMGVDMQSDSGIVILKNILKEFCTTYDVDYIHIGADEVKITNKNYVPEITNYIESFGKKAIGWQPGGNFTNSTIRQLWMDDNAHLSNQQNLQFIDSRHLYLNHMDPLEAVTTIFNRKIADKEKGDAHTLGGTICMWHDRAVNKDEDILKMNPVYPAMLAFVERSWRGGGHAGWISNMSDGDLTAFKEFEIRLLKNKELYFQHLPFPYVKQSDIAWKLYGPYDNKGVTDSRFIPETKQWDESEAHVYKEVIGGTIVLRHWWAPLINGAVDDPKENSTFYATTKIWSEEAGERNFWIGFNNISRSPATDSPPTDAWDNKNSEVWVNGKEIDPPKWKHAGMKGNSEWPLTDEGYEYRKPTKIYLQKGWNHILIKAPIASFKGKDWQNPVKWMFTFVEL